MCTIEGFTESKEYCKECFGTGQLPEEFEAEHGIVTRICPTCIGTGWILTLVPNKKIISAWE
jgi:DnaJ-class molecular chaperone